MKRTLAVVAAVLLLTTLAGPSAGADRPADASRLIATKIAPGLEKFDFATLGGFGQNGAKLALNQILKATCEHDPPGSPATTERMNCIDDAAYDSGKVALGQAFSPDNEIAIAVDPDDEDHLLAGSNDYFYSFILATGARFAYVPTGYFTSFNGGDTWVDGQIPLRSGNGAGDPSPAFDKEHGVALMAQLENVSGNGGFYVTQGDVSVSRSTDGGLTWSPPVTVMMGKGAGIGPAAGAVFFDKEWLTCDNDSDSDFYGRCYVTATRFLNGLFGSYAESPIWLSYSDDGGATWSAPKEISGSHASCTFQSVPPFSSTDCDEDQWSVPTVDPDGTVYVQFHNYQNGGEFDPDCSRETDNGAWEVACDFDAQIMVVKSTNGGASFSAPVPVIQIEDGLSDMPFSVIRRQTIYGHQLRWGAPGNIVVDPSNVNHLAIVYSEREDANPDATTGCFLDPDTGGLFIGEAPDYDPCGAGTSDDSVVSIYKVESTNGGTSWGARTLVSSGTKHAWFPWAGFKSDGTLVVAFDQDDAVPTADTFHHAYKVGGGAITNLGLAENLDISLTHWAAQYVSQANWPAVCGPAGYQDPPGGATEEGKDCNVFHGDYTGLAISSNDDIYIVWTGLNALTSSPQFDPYTGGFHDGYRQDAMFFADLSP